MVRLPIVRDVHFRTSASGDSRNCVTWSTVVRSRAACAPSGQTAIFESAYIAPRTTAISPSLHKSQLQQKGTKLETCRKRSTSFAQGFIARTATAVDRWMDKLPTIEHVHSRTRASGDLRNSVTWSRVLASRAACAPSCQSAIFESAYIAPWTTAISPSLLNH
jgi:hypothetical protein